MTKSIKVTVLERADKPYLMLRYTDPVTGKRHQKSAGTNDKREATKLAGRLERELESTGHRSSGDMTWGDFRELFIDSYMAGQSDGYLNNVLSTFSKIERVMGPDRLKRVNTRWLTEFRRKLIRDKTPDASVTKFFQHLKTMLKWAADQGYITAVPTFPAKRRGATASKKHMKGRPVTAEEFERMLEATDRPQMKYLLQGLWLSGLRLNEALLLTWDQWADGIRIQVDGRDVFLLIDAEDQKNRQTTTYPTTPDFADFLLRTPPQRRTGHVFAPVGARGVVSRRLDTVSDWIVAIGQKAKVKVDERKSRKRNRTSDEPEMVPAFASAHDLRRAFGVRWANRVQPATLRELMRHSSVETTLKFYVGINARETSRSLRQQFGSDLVTPLVTPDPDEMPVDVTGQQKHG